MSIQDVPIKNEEYRMRSGKYEGKSIGELLELDPNYLMMLHQKGYLTMQRHIVEEVKARMDIYSISAKQQKTTHTNDGRPIMGTKKYTGIPMKDWVCVKYLKVLFDSGYSVMLKLHNGNEIVVYKKRSRILKDSYKIYIEPKYYETDHKMFVENITE